MSQTNDIVKIGDATLYHGDCMDILPTLDKVDAVVTDPPYGIDIGGSGPIGGNGTGGGLGQRKLKYYGSNLWDKEGLSLEQWNAIKQTSKQSIIWGGNHLADILGSSAGVLVWDKKCKNGWDDTFSEMEIAWISTITRAKGFRHLWAGALRASEKNYDVKKHPTQKPIELMRWCLTFIDGNTVLDPFMGSGTTGVACAHTHTFIGIEKERKYFDIACERIEAAYAQGRLAL